MEDSQISALPPDLAAEAQTLRRDWETRNRQMQERILTTNFSNVLRNSSNRRKLKLQAKFFDFFFTFKNLIKFK